MKKNPLVSIICLTYNHEKYISETIDGILMQNTFFDYELIIANDCSSDKTDIIVRSYIKNHPKGSLIKYFRHDKNIGSQQNFIFAHKKCLGEYIAVCEGDDYWTDTCKLQKQVEFLEKGNEYSMCFTNSTIIDDYGKVKKLSRVPDQNKKDITQADILNGFVPPMNTVLYRNKFFNKIIAAFPRITNGDYYVSALMANYGKIGYLNINSAAYRMHESGTWSNLSDESRLIIFTKTLMSLKGKLQKSLEQILEHKINANLSAMEELNKKDEFLDNNFWTPQTVMFRSIRDTVLKIDGEAYNFLNIGKNKLIEKILCRKWPGMELINLSKNKINNELQAFNYEAFDIVFAKEEFNKNRDTKIVSKQMIRLLKKGGIGIYSTLFKENNFNISFDYILKELSHRFNGMVFWQKGICNFQNGFVYNLYEMNDTLQKREINTNYLNNHLDNDYYIIAWLIFIRQ